MGATPDGLVENDDFVKIKCSYSAAYMTPEEGFRKIKINYWKIDENGSILELKRSISGITKSKVW